MLSLSLSDGDSSPEVSPAKKQRKTAAPAPPAAAPAAAAALAPAKLSAVEQAKEDARREHQERLEEVHRCIQLGNNHSLIIHALASLFFLFSVLSAVFICLFSAAAAACWQ